MPHAENVIASETLRKDAITQRTRAAERRVQEGKEPQQRERTPAQIAQETLLEKEGRTFVGRSDLSPLEILMQKDRTTGRRKLFGELAEGGKAVGRAGFEVISEAGDALVALLGADIPGTEKAGDVLQAIRDFESSVAEGTAGFVGFGEVEDKEDPSTVETAGKRRREGAEKERVLTQKKRDLEQIDEAAASGVLGSLDQFTADQLKETIELELAQVEVDLLDLQNQLAIQDRIFEIQTEDRGLADDINLDPLKDALGVDGGLGAQTFQAITSIAENAALSAQQRDEAIDLVMARQSFSEELLKTVNDLVQTKNDQQALLDLPDIELLRDAGLFINPSVAFDVSGADDTERFLNDMFNEADIFLEQNVPASIPPEHESFATYANAMSTAMMSGVDHPDVQFAIDQLAEVWELDAGSLSETFKNARSQAEANKIAWDEALEADQARPFSGGLVAAIYQAGEAMGFDPTLLEMAAKSRGLHHLIDVKSQGKSGIVGDGTIAGMGGLTADAYTLYMGEEWNPGRGMQWELQALLRYIEDEFGSNAQTAVNFYLDSGEWGGSETLSSTSTFEDK